jgi:hypothetical protein
LEKYIFIYLFSNAEPHKVSHVLSKPWHDTHQDDVQFSPDIGTHFTGNTPCSSDDSVTHLVQILHFFTMNTALHNPQKRKPGGVNSGERGGQGMDLSLPIQ